MSLPARDDVAEEHRFDLTRIYDQPSDWDAAAEALESEVVALESAAADPLDSTAHLRSLLERVETCHRRSQRLELYATLAKDVNTDDEAAADRLRRYRDIESAVESAVATVRRRFRAADDEHLDDLIAGLDGYRRYAENLREQARHVRSGAVEETIAQYAETRQAPTEIIEAVTTGDFDPPAVERPDGETVDLRYGNRRAELSRGDRAYRRRVYEAYHDALDDYEATLTRAYAEKLASAAADAEVRGYDSIRDRDFRQSCYPESGLRSDLPEPVHDRMIESVRANLDPFHRAQHVRRERLGVEELRPWDVHVSIAGRDPPAIGYERAKRLILEALEPLGDDYAERARSLFAERRIDVFPTQGKRTDIPAYCPSSAADGPFVLANFREDVRTTFFVCHELGHAMHVEHHREGPTRYATAPRPVEEIPSILHELLLAERFVETGDLEGAAYNRLLESIGGNFYGSSMNAAFVHRLAERVEDGEQITPERARETYADLQSEFHPAVTFDDRAGRNWLGRGVREPYSNYQYVLGATGALAVRLRLRDGDLSVDAYREFLRSTGRDSPIGLFEGLGLDVRSGDPYAEAAAAFDGYVDRMAGT